MQINKRTIEEMESRLINGIKNNDIDFLSNVMHNDLLGVGPNGQIITKEMDLASHKAGTMIVEEISSTIDNIQIFEDTAVVIITYNTKGKMLGNPIEGIFRYNRIWKKFDNGLKIISVNINQL